MIKKIISIQQGIEILKNNETIAFPTETVYGLGANAYEKTAYTKIYTIKNRPTHNPLIIHCHSLEQAKKIAIFNSTAYTLAQKFWPGPLSILLPKQKNINIINKKDTVCIRIPSHPIAQKLLQQLPFPLAAPSANISNHISATTAQHVYNDFKEKVPIIEGNIEHGIESTIIDCLTENPKILRHGSITYEHISQALQSIILHYTHENINKNLNGNLNKNLNILSAYKQVKSSPSNTSLNNSSSGKLSLYKSSSSKSPPNNSSNNNAKNLILSPGQLTKHYAPRIPLYINISLIDFKNILNNQKNPTNPNHYIYIIFGDDIKIHTTHKNIYPNKQHINKTMHLNIKTYNLSISKNLLEAAKNLYSTLRLADNYAIKNNIKNIYIQPIPNHDIGIAINDKLHRAKTK